MVKKSFANDVRLDEVSIAIERLLIAPYPTTWTPGVGRVDLTPGSLPAGFHDLGAVVEDTPTLRVTKTKFSLSTGVPAVRQYEATIGLEGTLEFSLHSTSWRKLQVALGNLTAVSSATLLSSVISVNQVSAAAMVLTLSSSVTSDVTAGDQIVLAASGKQDDIDAGETTIRSIVTNNASVLVIYCTPSIPQTPTTSFNAYRYDYVEQYYGTATNREFTLLGVADFIDGGQIVHEFPRCQPGAEFERAIRPGENLRLPLSFNLFGVSRSIRGQDELILAREVHYPPRASATS